MSFNDQKIADVLANAGIENPDDVANSFNEYVEVTVQLLEIWPEVTALMGRAKVLVARAEKCRAILDGVSNELAEAQSLFSELLSKKLT